MKKRLQHIINGLSVFMLVSFGISIYLLVSQSVSALLSPLPFFFRALIRIFAVLLFLETVPSIIHYAITPHILDAPVRLRSFLLLPVFPVSVMLLYSLIVSCTHNFMLFQIAFFLSSYCNSILAWFVIRLMQRSYHAVRLCLHCVAPRPEGALFCRQCGKPFRQTKR